ncbi:MAG TPA: BON domain-containing protein [Sphingobacteriaceae bacterium]
MKTDLQIQKDVMDEIRWDPYLNSAEIGVAVKNGVVSLSGMVDSYSKKLFAEVAAKRVAGVKALAEDIQVGNSPSYRKTDAEIAEAVLNALKWHTAVQEDQIQIKVEDGNVRLEGEVDWAYQRDSANTAIQNLNGVRTVINMISIKSQATPFDIKQKISAAFQRSANLDAEKITIEVSDNQVILRGKVRSLAEKEDAESAAWAAPGITRVDNRLEIEETEYALED